MPTKKISILIFLLASVMLTGSACNKPKDLFIYKTVDSGKNWEQKAVSENKKSLATFSVLCIAIDKNNPNNIVIGTLGNGIMKSQNAGDTWQQTSLKQGTINAVAINPKDSNVIYAGGSIGTLGKMYKSTDAGANFNEIYSETHAKIDVMSILVDHFNPKIIYAGLTNGGFLKSSDSGNSWLATNWFSGPVATMEMSPKDSRKIYVAIKGRFAYVTKDGGKTWKDLKDSLVDFRGANLITAIQFDPRDDRIIYLGSHYGVTKSIDDGKKWIDTGLLLDPGKFTNVAMAVSPKSPEIIYVGVDTTIHKSVDGGKNWNVKKITNNVITSLVIDPKNTQNVYTGIMAVKQ
ncbi:MAG: YCF48-related protein [Patescibacteria group bacterium]|jgi:photosystem II stability/assembly factor-like uncharacterized protein